MPGLQTGLGTRTEAEYKQILQSPWPKYQTFLALQIDTKLCFNIAMCFFVFLGLFAKVNLLFFRRLRPCRFQGLSGEVAITNLPTRELEVPLQHRVRRHPFLLRGPLRGRFRALLVEVAVADEEPHHREVSSAAPCVHLEVGEVLQGLLHDSSPSG